MVVCCIKMFIPLKMDVVLSVDVFILVSNRLLLYIWFSMYICNVSGRDPSLFHRLEDYVLYVSDTRCHE